MKTFFFTFQFFAVFLWKCGATIVQSDVQLNSVATRWTLLAPVDSSETNLQSELLHDFGHIAGLEHCKIGDTTSICSARLGSFWEDFKQTDTIYRLPLYKERIAANHICYWIVKLQMSSFDSNDLKLQRKFLTMGIYTAFKSKQDAQNGYLSFDPNFIEYTIQKHTELRNKTIDAIGGR